MTMLYVAADWSNKTTLLCTDNTVGQIPILSNSLFEINSEMLRKGHGALTDRN